jgi:hypothetical protein
MLSENEFLCLPSQYTYVSLIGDFNGRTSVEKDYFLFDEKDEANTFSDFIENGASCLDLLESPRERKIKDLGKNRHGALLLDCCKGNNMFILNGRLSGDKDGNFTCKGTSVVDYCISNVHFLCKFHCLNFYNFLVCNLMYIVHYLYLYMAMLCLMILTKAHPNTLKRMLKG